MRALLFPGQGSQKVGMGAELARTSEAARRIFEEADEVLGERLSRLCWEGPDEELVLTANAQPAILTTSIAVLRALQERGELVFGACAGHSLGEWSALVAADSLRFADAVRLVRLRGEAMQGAVPAGVGAMAALIGLAPDVVDAICAEAAQGEVVSPANLNGAGQIVIAGHKGAVERAMTLAMARGAKLAKLRAVSAPFHCALMAPAAERLAVALSGVRVADPRVPVVHNADPRPNQSGARAKELLVAQVTQPVRWEACVGALAELSATEALELGAGTVLAGLVRRIAPKIAVTSVERV